MTPDWTRDGLEDAPDCLGGADCDHVPSCNPHDTASGSAIRSSYAIQHPDAGGSTKQPTPYTREELDDYERSLGDGVCMDEKLSRLLATAWASLDTFQCNVCGGRWPKDEIEAFDKHSQMHGVASSAVTDEDVEAALRIYLRSPKETWSDYSYRQWCDANPGRETDMRRVLESFQRQLRRLSHPSEEAR